MNDTVMQCSCENEFQDKVYGKKQRVHTVTNKGHRCTNCGTEKTSGSIGGKKAK